MQRAKKSKARRHCRGCNRSTLHLIFCNGNKKRPIIVCTCCDRSQLKRDR